jgi:hypothetical protein
MLDKFLTCENVKVNGEIAGTFWEPWLYSANWTRYNMRWLNLLFYGRTVVSLFTTITFNDSNGSYDLIYIFLNVTLTLIIKIGYLYSSVLALQRCWQYYIHFQYNTTMSISCRSHQLQC